MPEKAPPQPAKKEANAATRQQLRQLAHAQVAQLQVVSGGSGVMQFYRPNFTQVNEVFLVQLPKRVDTVVARFLRPSLNFDHYIFEWHGQEVELPESSIIGPRPTSQIRPSSYRPPVPASDSEEDESTSMDESGQEEATSSISPSFSFPSKSSLPQTSSSLFAPTSSFGSSSLFSPQPSHYGSYSPSSPSAFSTIPSLFASQSSSVPSSLVPPQPSFGLSFSSFGSQPVSSPPSSFSAPQPSFASLSSSLSAPSQPQPSHQVVSGHGRFNEAYLLDDPQKRRGKKATFKVPDNITLIMYAPNGAALNNDVANAIEEGNYPRADQLEMKQSDGSKIVPVPTPYPYVFGPGSEAINYTVMPPDKLSIKGSPILVDKAKSLFDVVSGVKGNATVHYACCSAGSSEKVEFRDLFPDKGYHVRYHH